MSVQVDEISKKKKEEKSTILKSKINPKAILYFKQSFIFYFFIKSSQLGSPLGSGLSSGLGSGSARARDCFSRALFGLGDLLETGSGLDLGLDSAWFGLAQAR